MRRSFIAALAAMLPLLSGITAYAQKYSVSTNLVGWADLGTANLELSASLGRHFTAQVKGRYNPWTFRAGDCSTQFQNRKRSLCAGVRWWPWYVYSGWWCSISGQWMEYNRGGLLRKATEEGDAFGGVLSLGYTLMIHRSINLEFGISGWGGATKYKSYQCPVCGTLTSSGVKPFVLPDDAIVSIVYVF